MTKGGGGFGTVQRKEVKLSEVLNAIRVIKRYIDVRDKINELLVALASAGIDVSRVNFNNPMSLISVLSKARQQGVDVDVETIFEEIEEGYDVSLDEVDEAVRVLKRFAMTSRSVDGTLKVFSRMTKTSISDLNAFAQMFGLKVPTQKSSEVVEEVEEEDELSEEDIEDLREIVKKYRSGEL